MSIPDLANAAGMSTRTIIDIGRDRTVPRLLTMRKPSEQLEVAPSEVEEFKRAIEESSSVKNPAT